MPKKESSELSKGRSAPKKKRDSRAKLFEWRNAVSVNPRKKLLEELADYTMIVTSLSSHKPILNERQMVLLEKLLRVFRHPDDKKLLREAEAMCEILATRLGLPKTRPRPQKWVTEWVEKRANSRK